MAPMDSMASQTRGTGIPYVLEAMAQRYIGANPPHHPVYRVTRTSPVRKLSDHSYEFPMGRLYPDMKAGQRIYAWAKLWVEEEHEFIFLLRAFGPVRLYLNGAKHFGTALEEEQGESSPLKLKLPLVKGWNHFVLELGKAGNGGCGVRFGTGNRKNKPLHFLSPSLERDGEEGWIYTAPLNEELSLIPQDTQPEAWLGTSWLPERAGIGASANEVDLEALFGQQTGSEAYAWTSVVHHFAQAKKIIIAGTSKGSLTLEWQGRKVYEAIEPGSFSVEVEAAPGASQLVARATCAAGGWGFSLQALQEGFTLAVPRPVHGAKGPWLHLGPVSPSAGIKISDYMSLDRVAPGTTGDCFWITGERDANVRPFLENELFGRWNYPLGVTLFGLLETSRLLDRSDIGEYVARHVEFATSTYDYSLWDRKQYGAAGLNNQLSHVDSLDDCGSFGALALLADRIRPLKGIKQVSSDIARFIMETQERLDDGALYRREGVSISMRNTMWCDDMYMSVPFLCRYSEYTGDSAYRDEAARQLLLYRKYLYMPEMNIMSHVYSVAEGRPSGTAWGRGNGWVFFSLAVLLEVLPREHKDYEQILVFYRELAQGYLRLQGPTGLWHQVLTDHESYEESSCTSMFMYGFARGVRFGWLEEPGVYADAVQKGWEALCGRAIDKRGNLYGVCKGSSWSFSHSYYKHDLGWSLNDTHGIGIVLLAGIEAQQMKESL